MSGELDSRPKSIVRWYRTVVSTRVLDTKLTDSKTARFQRKVTSSSAPHSTYSRAKCGTSRRAIERNSSMERALRKSSPE